MNTSPFMFPWRKARKSGSRQPASQYGSIPASTKPDGTKEACACLAFKPTSGGPAATKNDSLGTDDRGDFELNIPFSDALIGDGDYGITLIRNPRRAVIDIVFVHGLTGNARTTWLDEQTQVHWPRDLLHLDIGAARIMTFGYDADVVNFLTQAAQDSISGYANDLLGSLAGQRTEFLHNYGIIFVAHSLGGLVVKRAITLSRESRSSRLRDIETHTRGIVFLGTPHHGSDLAKWGGILTELANLANPANRGVVKVLQKDSDMLADLRNGFHNVVEKRKMEGNPIQLCCFYETLPLFNSLVVPKYSAVISGEDQFPIHKNHKDMTKFSTREAKGYRDIIGERLKLDEEDFKNQAPKLLRITGKPGCGKSVLGASLFRQLSSTTQQQSKITSLIFYAFNGRDASRRSPVAMLSSLARQLLDTERNPTFLLDHFNLVTRDRANMPADILGQFFRLACRLQDSGHVICIIDGLDECDPGSERDGLVSDLEALLSQPESRVTIIMLNRDYWEINFQNASVSELLKKRPAYGPYRERLLEKIFERASNGMLLMVKLLVEMLYRSVDSSPFGINRTINSLPTTIRDVYEEIWESIDPASKPRAREIMGWLVALFQPVAVNTLADALAHETLLNSDDDELSLADATPMYMYLSGDLKRLFGPLVCITDRVELVHQTVREFFLLEKTDGPGEAGSSRDVLSDDRHVKIVTSCLFCLSRNYNPQFSDASSVDTLLGIDVPPFYPFGKKYCSEHEMAAVKRKENPQAIDKFQRAYGIAKKLSCQQRSFSDSTSVEDEKLRITKRRIDEKAPHNRSQPTSITSDHPLLKGKRTRNSAWRYIQLSQESPTT
ncbi:hypothetical protein AJ79_05953 [Helicocarpus griseus UAMH5409]|uniref:NACHT domain-containing protein n=1 Tax=Helicocarpus griseus UAMH5409 TaxID=1447875 RepID=A0A2B7XIR1_9EURO|nr:hypothetical protein AJ79_05953 [Helicocarpus griseus UAMH5409]